MSAQLPNDLYADRNYNLDSFIATHVQPTDDFLSKTKAVVDRLVQVLQNDAPESLRPRRIIKGGSLGKGTAVKGKSDVDLDVMLVGYSDVPALVRRLPVLLQELQQFLGRYSNVTLKGNTRYNIKIQVKAADGKMISADILLAADVLAIEGSSEAVFRSMSKVDPETRKYFSPSLAPLQHNLYATLPTKLKSLIRLIKFWKSDKLRPSFRGARLPTSYVFETIILDAWQAAGKPTSFDMARALHAVLMCLVQHTELTVILDCQLGRQYIDRGTCGRPPFIIDPCNPFDDLYSKQSWSWDYVKQGAQYWLRKPLLNGLAGTKKKW